MTEPTSIGLSDFSLAFACPPAMARNNLRPTSAMFLQEKASSPCQLLRLFVDTVGFIKNSDTKCSYEFHLNQLKVVIIGL